MRFIFPGARAAWWEAGGEAEPPACRGPCGALAGSSAAVSDAATAREVYTACATACRPCGWGVLFLGACVLYVLSVPYVGPLVSAQM
jgi:hypothetical protein